MVPGSNRREFQRWGTIIALFLVLIIHDASDNGGTWRRRPFSLWEEQNIGRRPTDEEIRNETGEIHLSCVIFTVLTSFIELSGRYYFIWLTNALCFLHSGVLNNSLAREKWYLSKNLNKTIRGNFPFSGQGMLISLSNAFGSFELAWGFLEGC